MNTPFTIPIGPNFWKISQVENLSWHATQLHKIISTVQQASRFSKDWPIIYWENPKWYTLRQVMNTQLSKMQFTQMQQLFLRNSLENLTSRSATDMGFAG